MGKEKAEGEGKVEGGERKGIILRGEGKIQQSPPPPNPHKESWGQYI